MGTARPIRLEVARRSTSTISGRLVLKRIALGIAALVVGPWVLAARAEARIYGPHCERVFSAGKETLALVPGIGGQYLRLAYYWLTCRAVSPDACLAFGSMLAHRDVAIGEGTVIGAHAIVGCAELGHEVLVAARVSIVSGRFQHGRPADRARGEAGLPSQERIHIGHGTWIGENAVVMADVGEACTVAAGAVVVRPAEPGTTLMGNPARKVNL